MAYDIEFADCVTGHLRTLALAERVRVLDAIARQLIHEPLRETRNRKPLRPNPIAPWELRVGSMRVFYEVASDAPNTVRVLAIGKKNRNVLLIGRKEIRL